MVWIANNWALLAIIGIFVGICVGAMLDPHNRRSNPDGYNTDEEYWGL